VRSRNFRHSAFEIFGFGGDLLLRFDVFADAVFLRPFVVEEAEAFLRDEV
jgi:hypothetical protein